MQTKTVYIAEDGKQFDSDKECKEYENNKWFHELWNQVCQEDDSEGNYGPFNPYNPGDVFAFLQKHLVFTKKNVKMINEQA